MKLDSHQHFWNYDPSIYSWITDRMAVIQRNFSPEDLEPVLKKNDFNGCIAVQATQSEEETTYLLEIAAQYSFVKGVVGWVDLSGEHVKERLGFYSKNRFFKGVRHTVWDKEGEFMRDPGFQNGISWLTEFGLTYDILVFNYQLAGAVDLAKQHPEQAFVLDHLGKPQISDKPTQDWIHYIIELGKLPNVYCKLSGLLTETEDFKWDFPDFYPFLDVVMESFGSDRLLFGSDWPVCLSAGSYEDTVKILTNYFSNHPKRTLEKILGENAVHFYGIKQDS